MFSLNKTVVCLEFSKSTVFCALAQVTGRKVDILAVDSMPLDNDIIEEGVVYDVPHLQQVVKNLITSVSKSHNKIDSAWIAIPNNKVLITKFEVARDKKGINEDDLQKAVEEKFNHSAAKLFLISRPIHELNKKVFFLSDAIRSDHLQPYLEVLEPLDIPVESVFPSFQCIFEETRESFEEPTLLLYPGKKGFKFFLADVNGVYLEAVWGHNVIEFNENFDKAIHEVIQYAKQSREVAIAIKKIAIVDSNKFDKELLQEQLDKIGLEYNWIDPGVNNTSFDPVSILALKGLIKASMAKDFSKGFLGSQTPLLDNTKIGAIKNQAQPEEATFNSGYTAVPTAKTTYKTAEESENRWNVKSIIGSTVLVLALLILMFYLGAKIANKTTSPNADSAQASNSTSTQISPKPTISILITPTATSTPKATPTPTLAPLTKQQVSPLVLNGNNIAGEAAKINSILKNNGFNTKTPGNNPTKNIPTTTVTYKDQRAQILAEEIVKLIESKYPSAKAIYDQNAKEDILVVLGAQ